MLRHLAGRIAGHENAARSIDRNRSRAIVAARPLLPGSEPAATFVELDGKHVGGSAWRFTGSDAAERFADEEDVSAVIDGDVGNHVRFARADLRGPNDVSVGRVER